MKAELKKIKQIIDALPPEMRPKNAKELRAIFRIRVLKLEAEVAALAFLPTDSTVVVCVEPGH